MKHRDNASNRLARLVLVVITSVAACGVPTESEPRTVADDRLPEALRQDVSPGSSAGPDRESVRVWLLLDTGLTPVVRRIEPPITALAVVESLGAGPSESERDDLLRSAIPDASMIVDASVTGGTAVVNLDESFDQIPASDQVLAIGQLVLTLTNLRGVGQVRFQIEGEEVAVPLPDGQTVDSAVSADDYSSLVIG